MARHTIVPHGTRLIVGAAVLAAVLSTATTTAGAAEPGGQPPTPPPTPMMVAVKAEFAPASAAPEAEAVTYDTKLVPEGSRVQVMEMVRGKGMMHDNDMHDNEVTRVQLRVNDLVANRTYGAHVHTGPCGERPDSSGPHYQNEQDPEKPSVDSKYANRENEVWLDFTTDENGTGKAAARVDWQFRERGARSLVIHESATATQDGRAGIAGDRVACVNVPFA
jgi:Cu-Zn family superoxide dismutase